ncbi:MAG: ACT domain-containing protein, partial [Chloroflexota bacterium]
MAAPSLTLSILPGVYAICRLEPNSPLPDWASGSFFSIT